MIRYSFNAIGFKPGGSGWYTCTKIGNRQHKRRNNIQNNTKTIQKHRIHKIEHKIRNKNKHKNKKIITDIQTITNEHHNKQTE
jgi:hypothetical protein